MHLTLASARRVLSLVALLSGAAVAAPPESPTRPVVDTYGGVQVTDPYRWLEGVTESAEDLGKPTEEVTQWTQAQNAHTREVLGSLPGREALEARMRQLLESGSVGLPSFGGNRAFYTRRDGAQSQPVVMVREPAPEAEGAKSGFRDRVLLDPFAVDPTGLTSVQWISPSPDGELLAFGVQRAGDENTTLHVLRVDSGEWLADEIRNRASIAGWLPDGSGFVYDRLEEKDDPYSNTYAVHELGRHWTRDPVIFRQRDVGTLYADRGLSKEQIERLRTGWGPGVSASDDGRWLVMTYAVGTDTVDMWVADLDLYRRTSELARKPVILDTPGRHEAIAMGDDLYVLAFGEATNGRVVRADPHNPGAKSWVELVPHRADVTITGISLARGMLVLSTLRDASTTIELYTLDGKAAGTVRLPGIGSAGISVASDRTEAFLSYTSFNQPPAIYSVNLSQPEAAPVVWAKPDVAVTDEQLAALEVRRVTYPSKDGTEVGMFIVHKKGISLSGDNPTLLYGYGGFNISQTPAFNATLMPFLEAGGVYAVANLRGGGEKGLAWHRAGQLDKKQNVFDDFIAAGEWLVGNGYTKPERLAVMGGSNGGLLVGAVAVQRPDLFRAVVCAVPLLDMLRYQNFLMARYWVGEYGSSEDPVQLKTLLAYSPYHNVKPGTKYPAMLITAGENDTRVHPLHARKFAAALQAATTSDQRERPILLWVDYDGGHGQGKPLAIRIREAVDTRIFVMWQLGMLEGAPTASR